MHDMKCPINLMWVVNIHLATLPVPLWFVNLRPVVVEPFPHMAQVLPLRQQEERNQDVTKWEAKDGSERDSNLESVEGCGSSALPHL